MHHRHHRKHAHYSTILPTTEHRAVFGNELRASVLGANDGLVSNFCLMMGIAGTGVTEHAMFITGLAALAAGACSMALGEWLSVSNARELEYKLVENQHIELSQNPAMGHYKLTQIFSEKGLPIMVAKQVAAHIMQYGDAALDTLAREDLGINPKEPGGSPWTAAIFSFLSFALGAIIPVLPLSLMSGPHSISISVTASVLALAAIGVLTSRFNGHSVIFSSTRQVVFGCIAAAVTYGLGTLLGVSLS
jgi:VIT1/CCC1 family predicted Fe2+/Mn2+ transporter